MKKFLFLLSLLISTIVVNARIITTVVNIPNYGPVNIVYSVPDGTSVKLPTVIFVPGSGESNSNVNDLYKNGPLHFIQNGTFKPNFVVVGFQPNVGLPTPPIIFQRALDSIFKSGNFTDSNRFYLTGLSYGAATIVDYVQSADASYFMYPSAMVPMSINIHGSCGGDSLCGNDLRISTIPWWGFCGNSDAFYTSMFDFFQTLNQAGYTTRFTTFVGGHCCWNTYYDPNYRENGMNIYDWMLKYPTGPLALTFLSFDYDYQIGLFQWSFSSDEQVDHFEIEESTDDSTWTTIGQVPYVNGQSNYSFKF